MFDPSHYRPPSTAPWDGRRDDSNSFRMHEKIACIDLAGLPLSRRSSRAIGLLGCASDIGIGGNPPPNGSYTAPEAIRRAMAPLPMPKKDLLLYDFGDIVCTDGDLETAQELLKQGVEHLLKSNITPFLLGGGHEIAWGHYLGITSTFPTKKLAVFNFNPHFGLQESIGEEKQSSFLQIAKHAREHPRAFNYNCLGIQSSSNTQMAFEKGAQLHAKYILADEFHLCGIEPALELIDEQLAHVEIALISICLDLFAYPFAPGVNAPQPLGLFPWHVIPLLHRLSGSGKVVGIDIAELSPARDRDGITAQLAAQLLYHAAISMP